MKKSAKKFTKFQILHKHQSAFMASSPTARSNDHTLRSMIVDGKSVASVTAKYTGLPNMKLVLVRPVIDKDSYPLFNPVRKLDDKNRMIRPAFKPKLALRGKKLFYDQKYVLNN